MTEPAVIEYGSASAAALPDNRPQSSVPLYRNRTFAAVYAGNTLSVLGEGFHTIAIGYWVLSTTGSAQAMAAVMLPQMIVGLLLGAVAGTLQGAGNGGRAYEAAARATALTPALRAGRLA